VTDQVDLTSYNQILHENAGKFHANFNAGDFDANGPLATERIRIDSNNVRLSGRQNFVNRIKRFSVPFPALQLNDEVRIIDGNVAAVMYLMQGVHGGPYGEYQPTHNKVEAAGGEVFEFDETGLMKSLTTTTELDQVEACVRGIKELTGFRKVHLVSMREEPPLFVNQIRSDAAALYRNLDRACPRQNVRFFSSDFIMTRSGKTFDGGAAFNGQFDGLRVSFPDLVISSEYVLAEGNWAGVAYVLRGTQTSAYSTSSGTVLPPSDKKIEAREMSFLEFGPDGLLVKAAVISNARDIEHQLQAG
jgi:hypothetical protein